MFGVYVCKCIEFERNKIYKICFLTEILYKIVFAYGGLLGGCYNCSYLMVKQRNICLVVVAGGFFFLLVIDRG